MFSKSFIMKLSKAMCKPKNSVEISIREFLLEESLLSDNEIKKFFLLCIENNEPRKRYLASTKFLSNKFSGQNLFDSIIGLMNIDPCFKALAMFNIQDWINSYGFLYKEYFLIMSDEEIESGDDYFDEYGFLPPISSWMSYHWVSDELFSEDVKFYSSAERMTHRFVDTLIYETFKVRKTESLDFFYTLYERIGLKIIDIEYFRYLVNESSILGTFSSNFYSDYLKMKEIFNNPFPIKRSELTLKRNWLYYLIIEELKNKGFQTAEATKKLHSMTGDDRNTIRRNYFRMKSEAQNKRLTKEEILRQNELSMTFRDHMAKIMKTTK